MRTASETEIAWLAGLLDGEGCVAVRRLSKSPSRQMVQASVELRMNCKETVDRAAVIVAALVQEEPQRLSQKYANPGASFAKRTQWGLKVIKKNTVQVLLEALYPYLVTKRLEAGVVLAFLARSAGSKVYRATAFDHMLCELSTQLKKGRGEARADAESVVRQVIPSQATVGSAQAEGAVEGVQTTRVTPKNNLAHEPPATLKLVQSR